MNAQRSPCVVCSKEKGKRLGVTGKEIRSNREKGTGKLIVGGRPHKLGRATLYIGALALIYPSGRQNPTFILFAQHRGVWNDV
jgi:hypothetical protein